MAGQLEDLVGQPVEALDTPALLVDAGVLHANLRKMADFFSERTCRLRPHFKSHKCVSIARRQLQAGSCAGITCAKLSEAEALAAGGVEDILVANQVVGQRKMERLAELAGACRLTVAVDCAGQLEPMSRSVASAGATLGVLVEVDIGMGRCGVPAGPPAVELAREVQRHPGLQFLGIQAYEGHCVGIKDPDERCRRTEESMSKAISTRRLMEAEGMSVSVLSGGGTGTYDISGVMDGVDEIQAGSYALMDHHYKQRRPEFGLALSVLATVISSSGGRAVLDVGVKGVGAEFGPPILADRPEDEIPSFKSEEHTIVMVRGDALSVGDKVRLIPSHGCTTCNFYRRACVVRDGSVEAVWPIEGSGCLT